MNLVLNVTDHIPYIKLPIRNKEGKIVAFNDLTRLESAAKMYEECANILSARIAAGQLDATKEHTLFVTTRFGAASVTIIPNRNFQ